MSVGDFNGDGHPDLAVTSFIPPGGGGSALLVWLNDGSGGFGGMTKYPTDGFGSNPIGSTVADFDQDGTTDVVAANDFADSLSLFTGTGSGAFNAQRTLVVGDRPTWVVVADFTGDGRPDLAVVNSNSGSVTVINTPKPATHFQVDAVDDGHGRVRVPGDGHRPGRGRSPGRRLHGAGPFRERRPPGRAARPATRSPSPTRGSHTFDVTLKTAGSRTVTVTSQFGTLNASVQVDRGGRRPPACSTCRRRRRPGPRST